MHSLIKRRCTDSAKNSPPRSVWIRWIGNGIPSMTRSRKSSVFRAFLRGYIAGTRNLEQSSTPCIGTHLERFSSCPSGRGLQAPAGYSVSAAPVAWIESTALHPPRSRSCEWSREIVLVARAVANHSGFAVRLCVRHAIGGSSPDQPRKPSGLGCGVDDGFETGAPLLQLPGSGVAICEVSVEICHIARTRGRHCRSRDTCVPNVIARRFLGPSLHFN
jgi:hypothetical protein